MRAPDELNAAETGEWVALAMQQLSTDQRLTLELAYGQGYSCAEIAEIMGCPVNTVKTRMFHARGESCAQRFCRSSPERPAPSDFLSAIEPDTSLAAPKRDRTSQQREPTNLIHWKGDLDE